MALRNPKLFGLNVLSFFADVENKNLALQNLNLPPIDLEVILGSSDAGANRSDWISFSRLHDPLHKTLDRFNRDSSNYNGILLDRAGADGVLFGNLKINGSLSGNAIRYRYVKGLGTNTREIGIADISTSRISAWSSSASPVLPTSPISYGARLGIKSTGKLKFGTSTITGPRLRTSIVPQEKEFPSEFPTHKIKLNIDGVDRELYAMKGIPVIFTGFFRNLDATIKVSLVSVDGNLISPSWKIVETGNILFANLILSGEDNSLYYFDGENNAGHYDKNGKSVEKALMKTPINGARLSSPFGMRKHPIDGFNKMHKGTDFAAPTGTPIMDI